MNEHTQQTLKNYVEEIDIDFDLPEDCEGNDIPHHLEHIDGNKLFRESMEDTEDDYYLKLMAIGEGERIRSESKESGSLRIKE